jgi:hypothetical protein
MAIQGNGVGRFPRAIGAVENLPELWKDFERAKFPERNRFISSELR